MDANEVEKKPVNVPTKTAPLKRINEEKISKLAHQFSGNTFDERGGDSYGTWSNTKLHDKHGANFIKEKNKMKKRNSHASGVFNMGAVNS